MGIAKIGYNKLKNAYEIASGWQRVCAKIKAELNILQEKETDKDRKRRYEIRKKMWANLQTRLYKEVYLIGKYLLPEYIKLFDIANEDLKRIKIQIEYNVKNEKQMKGIYTAIFNETNRRIYELRDTAVYMINKTDNEEIKNKLKETLKIFDDNVIECVGNCLYQHNKEIEKKIEDKNSVVEKVKKIKNINDVHMINI